RRKHYDCVGAQPRLLGEAASLNNNLNALSNATAGRASDAGVASQRTRQAQHRWVSLDGPRALVSIRLRFAGSVLRPAASWLNPAIEERGHMTIEASFDTSFVAALALREKQIQQNYRPIIAVHKWFARRPGTLFRALALAEFGDAPLADLFFTANE